MSAFLASGALGLGLVFSQMVTPAPAGDVGTSPALSGAVMSNVPLAQAPLKLTQAQGSGVSANAATSSDPASRAAAAVAAQPAGATGMGAAAAPVPAALAPATAPTPTTAGMQAPAAMPATGHRFLAYTSANVDGPYIAITFDDGPNPETTPKLLKILEARGIKATFFVVGMRASENPEMLQRMVAAGHEIGNHSWNHPQLPKVSLAEVDRQLTQTSAAIHAAIGKDPIYLRPPYGAMTPALRRYIEDKYGLTMVYWSADSLDWKNRDAQAIYDKVMAQTRPGGIILMHDIHATTVAAVPRVLDALLAKGYKFVTVSELIAMNKPVPPKTVAALAPAPVRKKPKPQATPVSVAPVSVAPGSAKPAKPAGAAGTVTRPAAATPATSLF
ncbi:polysaccharide deacetylase family protein [Xanthobacter agilis]|uniref:Chitooligosaccharide deacetylase n=1 Tax=Xanthobacter agilis TaxID=47492 RepID=A0ABU0LB80_XANAG|nr:polysaccharide deacetylase family protein [Xanthobacter agilis]MDQ0504402.1 peptidoglycan/xylan/chitin deacetylase (PgdA/CDA1 family) [Xanthobacter agilis]